jgi:hypothetical protein
VTALLNEAWEVLGNPERRHRYDGVATLDSRSPTSAANQTIAPRVVWLVIHFHNRTVRSAWSSEEKAVLAARSYRECGSSQFFKVAPVVVDPDHDVRPVGERSVDDLD